MERHEGFDALQKGLCRVYEIRTGKEIRMARMTKGWIKIHRSIFDSWVFQDANHFQGWIWLLMTANHYDTNVLFKGEQRTIARGQLLTTLDEIVSRCNGFNKGKVRRFLELLE